MATRLEANQAEMFQKFSESATRQVKSPVSTADDGTLNTAAQRGVNDFVGFTAIAGSQDVDADEVIKFGTIRINVGGHYDSATGEFTCPVSGYYYVLRSILSPS